jgi:ribose transport system ATP-binding protein
VHEVVRARRAHGDEVLGVGRRDELHRPGRGVEREDLVALARDGAADRRQQLVEQLGPCSLVDRLRGRGAIDAAREAELVEAWIDRLGIRTAGADAPITTLSGGNQQKVVMARCLALGSSVLALCEPTAGVDIGTRIQLYDLVAEQARAGVGVIVSSSDEGDLLGMCTRVLVLRRGAVAAELTGDDITEANLLHAMEGTD